MEESWPRQTVAILTEMYIDGASASKIAAEIGKSRSAVIGKAHRLNLHKEFPRPRSVKRPRRPQHITLSSRTTTPKNKPFPKMISKVPISPSFVAEPVPPPELAMRHTIYMLSDKTCRFPINHPGSPDFYFCGHKPKEQSVYCPYHSTIAYQSPEQRIAERRA